MEQPNRALYLAVPTETYKDFFTRLFVRTVVANQQIKLAVYDVKEEVIVKWIE